MTLISQRSATPMRGIDHLAVRPGADLLRGHGIHPCLEVVEIGQRQAVEADGGKVAQELGIAVHAQRQAIVLTKIEGLSMVEASARTGVSVSALKVQVHRGLKRLAQRVREG